MNELGLSRAAAEALIGTAPAAVPWKPTLWPIVVGDREFIVKDVRRCRWIYRYTVGRWLLRREARIYAATRGLPFVPVCYGRLDRDALIFERLRATPLSSFPEVHLRAEFFERLAAALDQLHARSIAHMDLRHRSNIMVTAEGEPRLIDFESSFDLGRRPLLRRIFWRLLRAVDRAGLIKWRLRYFPDHVSSEDRDWFARFERWRRFWPAGRIWPPSFLRRRGKVRPTAT
ncbi:MAG: hypothetical protein IT458_16615 [Planctomycetes bacterium]|nr:hypothetical protein [Planctomycetota bacterium]